LRLLIILGCLIHKEKENAAASKRRIATKRLSASDGMRGECGLLASLPSKRIGFGRLEVDSRPLWSAVGPRIRGSARRESHIGVVLLLPETIRAEEDTKSQLCEQRALRVCGLAAPRGVLFRNASSGHAIPRIWVGVSLVSLRDWSGSGWSGGAVVGGVLLTE
jgi:hypothetical protein